MTAPGTRINWPGIAGTAARALLGEPNARMSTARELRYGTRGSLAVHVAGDRAGTWHDFEAGEGGGVLDLVRHVRQCDKAAALAWLADGGCIPERGPGRPSLTRPESRCEAIPARTGEETAAPSPSVTPRAPCAAHAAENARREDSRRFARRIWTETRPLAGTVAERYLAARGVGHVAGAAALRFHPALTHPTAPGRFPCLVASVQAADGTFAGIQRTYLAPDGSGKTSVDPVRASLGSLAGGAVRLAESIDGRLLLGEGIESTAAAVRVLGWTGGAFAALGASGLRAVALPDGVREVAIAADRDAGGLQAAAALAERIKGEGHRVEIRAPCRGDFADWLSEATS